MSESRHGLPETGPILLPVQLPAGWEHSLSSGSPHQVAGQSMVGLLPAGVDEPEFILRGNKLRCVRCGTTTKTRAKYIAHFQRRHK